MKGLFQDKADSRERLASWLPWLEPVVDPPASGVSFEDALRSADVIMTTGGGLLRCARIDPPDFESASPEALRNHYRRLTALCARFGNGWSITFDQWRRKAPGYMPESDFGGCRAAQLIDASRRRRFTNLTRPVFVNTAFVAVNYLPQKADAIVNWLMDRGDTSAEAHIAFFRENTDALFQELRHSTRSGAPGVTVLCGDELASYLHASVTYEPEDRMMPVGVLASQMASREWSTERGLQIDNRHVATVELYDYGSPDETVMEVLHELDFECRWTATVHGLDPDKRSKELEEVRKGWNLLRRGPGAIFTDVVTRGRDKGRVNPEVERNIAILDEMKADLASRPFGLAHCNVHVWIDAEGLSGNEEWDEVAHRKARLAVHDRASEVAALLKSRRFDARVATLNDIFAPLGDMPGNVTRKTMNARRSRIELSVFTRVAPVTGVIAGNRQDWRFKGPALLAGLTRRGSPYFWSLNAPGSDTAHTAIVGRTGSGKSALIGLMSAQFLRYEGARVVVFDRKRSFLVPCLAMGGDWIELGGGGMGVQPLRAIDRPEEFTWAQGWVEKALRLSGLEPSASTSEAVTDALRHVAELDPDKRTLTRLNTYLGADADARRALARYLSGGAYGRLLDGVVASYGDAPVLGIETQDVMQLEDIGLLTLSAVFRAIRRDRLIGDMPKMVSVDEAWALLRHPLFADEIEEWAREMRKLKAVLVLATQSLADLSTARARVIFDQLANRIYLPHAEAMRPQTRELYEAVGLLEQQIELIAGAQPKGEYLLQTEEAIRLVQIRLEDDALALCAASSPADHARAFDMLKRGVKPGDEFAGEWLSESTQSWLAGRQIAALAAA